MKTFHALQMTKYSQASTRAKQGPSTPKFWRPKLELSRQTTCQVIHWDLVTHFASGTATQQILWDWIETGLTYCQMAQLLAADGVAFEDAELLAMAAQIESYEAVIARFNATGRAGFSGPELAVARAAAVVMDKIISLDRHGIADRAARWSIEQMRSLRRTGKSSRATF